MAIPTHFLPHPPYAEDQPYPHLILTTHVLSRGFQTGALLGSLLGTARHLYTHRTTALLLPSLLRSSGIGGGVGVGAMAVAVPVRMSGREEIEWQDRSWRLLENRGQVECDVFSAVGAVAGAGVVAGRGWRGMVGEAGWRGMVGGAGLGGLLGVVGYMGWRYGVKRGEWGEVVGKVVEEANPAMSVEGKKKEEVVKR